jgi:hypothetical protein
MAEILGLGITHQPTLAAEPPKPHSLVLTLQDPGMPEHLRTPAGWPEQMRREWANDEGAAHGREHRDAVAAQLREARKALDEFRPDVVVVWGDDQFENFHDDVVPAFCVMGYDTVSFKPWASRKTDNAWHEPQDRTFTLHGHRKAAKYLATRLLEQSFDAAYAYRPLHKPLGHAFGNSLLYLDWDRKGFDYPVVPVSLNCFGRRLLVQKGYLGSLLDPLTEDDERLDPPSPSPARCFDFGAACARAFAASPWRVALVASSSWSHAFLTQKNSYLYPDHEADQRLYRALVDGDYFVWRSRTLTEIEDSGQHELLNWFCLAGAMAELERRPDRAAYFESSVMNSNKVIATFRPS